MKVHSTISIWTFLIVLWTCGNLQVTAQSTSWKNIVDTKAPGWSIERWINSEPLHLQDLKGKVVLVRWWLETCPYCQATASSLNEFHEIYAEKGLVIIGMYHPKPLGRKVAVTEVKHYADTNGFQFPIAIDEDWAVLKRYWFDRGGEAFTSVSFIIDRAGVIRYIHPGGAYNSMAQPYNNKQWQEDYFKVKAILESLLE